MVDSACVPSRPQTPTDVYEYGSDYTTPAPSLLSRPTTPVLLEPPSPHPPMTVPSFSICRSTPAPAPIVLPPPSSPPLIPTPPGTTAPDSPSALSPTTTKEVDLDLDPHYLATPIQRSYFVHLSDLFEKKAVERIADAEDVKKEKSLSRVLPVLRRASVVVAGEEVQGKPSWRCCNLC
ncbi:hypothetical protein NBRC10512_003831 [Rhodotorula toruloides]|uniref:RHTO0S02e04940g1_1 n=2 Tax=Rhodotorula toruloides TaxID=5286 RepID=A0A061AMS1_RHOTO|nr:uncharacterized protein RHTO_01153 [Rhodotorula toruloides NP11]EMS21938.1 hypothetical protein RHTO_01153 [Rhodotorula toruloides NP11]KAJ8296338.1 hypothetical protein OF846_000726 [Rhodotorula toruloides]CDR36644.1 RHTO0S02e04940g1_1 [Rhodotorula toruloides]